MDLDHLIRPVEQPFHDSLTSQEVGSASGHVLLSGPTSLSGLQEARGSRVLGLRAVAAVPQIMTGPDARDAMGGPEEETEPGNRQRLLPTAEKIHQEFFLPPARFNLPPRNSGSDAREMLLEGGREGASAQAALLFPGLKAEAELNTLLSSRREGSISLLRSRTKQMNDVIKDPRQRLTGL